MTKDERREFTKRVIGEIAKQKGVSWEDAAIDIINALERTRSDELVRRVMRRIK